MRSKTSKISLILANLFPIFGVLFLDWNLSSIMFLYWFENVVIGFYNVLRMSKAEKPNLVGVMKGNSQVADKSKGGMIIFFILHYGIFTFVHGVFVFAMFIRSTDLRVSALMSILFLFVSHGISYVTNYLGNREYEKVSSEDLMLRPYGRVMIMHLTVIFGGMFAIRIGEQSIGPLLVLTIVKTLADLGAHHKEHGKFQLKMSSPMGEIRFDTRAELPEEKI